jgi:hypothetical protein
MGEIQILLARQVRPVQSAQFAAGTRVWALPPVYVPPARTATEIAAGNADYINTTRTLAYSQVQLRARGRMQSECVERSNKARAANPRNSDAINSEYSACIGAVATNARAEAERGSACAQQIVGADPEGMKRDSGGTWQKIYDCAAASAPAPVAAAVPPPVAPAPAIVTPAPRSALTVTPTARAGALPIASMSAQWVGRSVIATGTVARVETIGGFEHLYFQGAGETLVVCFTQGLGGLKNASELVGRTVEFSARIDGPVSCLDQRVVGAAELRQLTQLRLIGDSGAR